MINNLSELTHPQDFAHLFKGDDEGKLEILVRDDGLGMDKKMLKKLIHQCLKA